MPTNLGMFAVINNATHRCLQAKDNGETHCSVPETDCHKEETWFLLEIDQANHLYALLNYNNQRLLSKFTNGSPCATAKVPYDPKVEIAMTETWIVMSGRPYGLPNCVAFRSAFDRTVLGANDPGSDTMCGGEVESRDVVDPNNHWDWPGWWRFNIAPNPPTDADPGLIKDITGLLGAAGKIVGNVVGGILDPVGMNPAN